MVSFLESIYQQTGGCRSFFFTSCFRPL